MAWAEKRIIVYAWLAAVGCIAALTGCPSTTTTDQVWHDPSDSGRRLGKTLVIAVAPRADTASAMEKEWVRQLQSHGVDAHAASIMLPGEPQPTKQRIAELAKSNGIQSVLVSRIVSKKTIEGQASSGGPPGGALGDYGAAGRTVESSSTSISGREAAVVETNLYDVATEKPFWSARSNTLLVGSAQELIQGFVQTMIEQMAKSRVL